MQAAESTQTRKENQLSGNIDLGAGSATAREKTGGSLLRRRRLRHRQGE
ncbi:hypothetical protein M8494_29530 [Serratia ureilytica]